tara:strand:+ start:258 stop:1100 length:843 start_codon:yes stop_codon:yes gene_type:complete
MKVVVTGATGFVGSYTVKCLLLKGYEVVSITTNKSITNELKEMLKGSEIVTINSLEDVSSRLIKNNCIIHCAWSNVQNTLALSHYFHAFEQIKFIEKLSIHKPKKLIITGTCSEFGLSTGPVSINDQTQPNTPYAQAKEFVRFAADKIINESAKIDLVWARLFYMYGKGQHDKSIYTQLLTAIKNDEVSFNMSKGEQLLDYMQVDEVADKLTYLVQNKSSQIVHICNGYPTLLRSLVESIIQEYNSSISLNLGYYQYRAQDSMKLWGSESFDSQMQRFEN